MKVFVDANVLITAAITPVGKAATVFRDAGQKGLKLITNAYALEEARRNIAAKIPKAAPAFEHLISSFEIIGTSVVGPNPGSLPAKDVPIWLSALNSGCDVLMAGDKRDFGALPPHPTLRILGPSELFYELSG